MLNVTRISRPPYARLPDIWLHHIKLADYYSIRERYAEVLEVVHQEVADYLNTPGLVFESEDGFPSLSRLTGQYYIADESYTLHVGPPWYQIGIQTHFLERPWYADQTDFDYLGLQVWIRCDPDTWSFSVFRNTDSSSL